LLVALPGPIALLATVPLVVLAGATLEQTLLCFIGASVVAVLVTGTVVHARMAGSPCLATSAACAG
jgi:hypothetical protein